MEEGRARFLYNRYPILVFVLPAILFLSLLSILHGVKLFQDMVCRNREKSNRIILEKQVMSLQEHMEEMERINSGIRSMKHDMKNTISVIWRLAARDGGEENAELQSYLSELNRTFEKLDMRFKTGNVAADTLLNMKYHEAVREVPDLNMDAEKLLFPQKLEIQSFDIGVILGNALDNAIDACRKLKKSEQTADAFIRLSSIQKGNLLILKVENSFDGCLPKRRQDGFPVSDKADKDSHGIGLANIRSTAEKYQGTMDFRVEGRVFVLSVMMKIFQNDVDESVTNWNPNGANPAMDSSGVQSRLHSIAGQKSIVVPPELEERMKNNPELAQQVMAKVEGFIANNQVPGRICSHLMVLDENGEIARFRVSSHGGNITGPTEEEQRQFEAEQAAKKKRREEYVRLNEESAWRQ